MPLFADRADRNGLFVSSTTSLRSWRGADECSSSIQRRSIDLHNLCEGSDLDLWSRYCHALPEAFQVTISGPPRPANNRHH